MKIQRFLRYIHILQNMCVFEEYQYMEKFPLTWKFTDFWGRSIFCKTRMYTSNQQPYKRLTASRVFNGPTSGQRPHVWSTAPRVVNGPTGGQRPHEWSTAPRVVNGPTSGQRPHEWSTVPRVVNYILNINISIHRIYKIYLGLFWPSLEESISSNKGGCHNY